VKPGSGAIVSVGNSMVLRAVILWLHVLSGVAWIGVSASFTIAAAVLASEPGELYTLAVRTAPRINRLSLPMATLIPLTGIGNILFAASAHGFVLPAEFVGILAVKILLFTAMAIALWWAWKAEVAFGGESQEGQSAAGRVRVRELMRFYGVIIGAGMVALALGLWLSGV
jgi:hypothetical protein